MFVKLTTNSNRDGGGVGRAHPAIEGTSSLNTGVGVNNFPDFPKDVPQLEEPANIVMDFCKPTIPKGECLVVGHSAILDFDQDTAQLAQRANRLRQIVQT